jgi:hypothetical protein
LEVLWKCPGNKTEYEIPPDAVDVSKGEQNKFI